MTLVKGREQSPNGGGNGSPPLPHQVPPRHQRSFPMRQFLKKWLRQPSPARRTPPRRPRRADLAVEGLEERQLLAASPLVFDMNLHPHRNNGLADTILARPNGSQLEIFVNGQLNKSVFLVNV